MIKIWTKCSTSNQRRNVQCRKRGDFGEQLQKREDYPNGSEGHCKRGHQTECPKRAEKNRIKTNFNYIDRHREYFIRE